jgi:hypothetical protein
MVIMCHLSSEFMLEALAGLRGEAQGEAMWTRKILVLLTFLTGALFCIGSAQAQTQPAGAQKSAPTANSQSLTVNQVIDRIIDREIAEIPVIRQFNPIVETYIQDMKSEPGVSAVTVRDHYLLGQADLPKDIVDRSMLTKGKGKTDQFNPISHLDAFTNSSLAPESFLKMIYVDPKGFGRQHYQFQFARREFLGEVRCVVFDVTPLPESGKDRFKGRIWAEDENYTIVRFNGSYTPLPGINGVSLSFDSWRLNVQPGVWLPSNIFSQESELKNFLVNHIRFKSQTRLWGYGLKNVAYQQLNSAELAVLDRLQRIGLLAPPGEVDKVLETVINNLEVTNNLDIQPEIHCRVLLTGTLESFSIGHTIVLSRGLLDVLPDEASLATMLAQELATIIVTRPETGQGGFNDMTNVAIVDALSHFTSRYTQGDVDLANKKAVELLKNSPYKDKLQTAGLFLKQLDSQQKALPALINSHLGNKVVLATQLMTLAPNLHATESDQMVALSIGARIKLDPWSDQVQLLKSNPVALSSSREKMPFEVAPFMPHLARYGSPAR